MADAVLVTGASGFLGGSVVPALVARGHRVTALARSEAASERVRSLGAEPLAGDLDDATSLDAAFAAAGTDRLVNLASLGFGHATAIVAAAEEACIRRAVFVSTTSIFTTLPAASKPVRLAAEATIRESALDWTILRPTMIYGGPGDRNMWRMLRLLRRSPIVPLPDGGTTLQQPVHVADLADVIVSALERDVAIRESYDLAGPDALSFRQVVDEASRGGRRRTRTISVPTRPVVRVCDALERVGATMPVKAEQIRRLTEHKAFDITPAQIDLDFHPRPFADGIALEAALSGEPGSLLHRAGLYVRTVAHLRPEQVWHRARLRTQRTVLRRWSEPFERRWAGADGPSSHWPAGFEPLAARFPVVGGGAERNATGVFAFLNEERRLGAPIDWNPTDAPQLWRYHLHYWEWAWGLARHPDRAWAQATFALLWEDWREASPFGRWDAWAPYPTSLRAWTFCALYDDLVRGTAIEAAFVADLRLHAGYLRANLELDVGGNHLIKNMKAIVGLGAFLDDDRLVRHGLSLIEQELAVQVMSDGGHDERSPSYHCQVLADLIDIEQLCAAAGREVDGLGPAITGMRRWLAVMRMPDGDVPLFNDCVLVGPDVVALLAQQPSPGPGVHHLDATGYVVMRSADGAQLVADVGWPCPPSLPAHAHADTLSFELFANGRRVVVDPGTSTYSDPVQRRWERSTAAHNTVTIDGQDSSEVWGTFRAARLAEPGPIRLWEEDGRQVCTASHHGYDHLPGRPRHQRTWTLSDGQLDVTDEVSGTVAHDLASRVTLSGGRWACGSANEVVDGEVTATAVVPEGLNVQVVGAGFHSAGFGEQQPATAVLIQGRAPSLPVHLTTTIVWSTGLPAAGADTEDA